jgi:hypothetical protein
MERFLLHQVIGERQGSLDIFPRQIIFPLHLLDGHTGSQAADNDGDWHTGSLNERFAMTDGWVDLNAMRWVHGFLA